MYKLPQMNSISLAIASFIVSYYLTLYDYVPQTEHFFDNLHNVNQITQLNNQNINKSILSVYSPMESKQHTVYKISMFIDHEPYLPM